MTLSRRDTGLLALASLLAGTVPQARTALASGDAPPAHDMSAFPAHWNGNEKIAFLAYPGFTALDLVGPHYMLASLMGATTLIVAKTMEPVASDLKLAIMPSVTFETCPADLDIICVPGGSEGTLAAIEDGATMAFVRDRGSRARFITSVCTGSMVLGAAGLLKGYKATSHWATREVLRDFGAEPVDARVVVDRNRITGAGVTAGLDFGLSLVAMLRDETYAQSLQLLAEYDPAPPFSAGTLAKAPRGPADMMSAMLQPVAARFAQAAKQARAAR
jgi:cyclohexyl-isocyanide hydratase